MIRMFHCLLLRVTVVEKLTQERCIWIAVPKILKGNLYTFDKHNHLP